MQLVKHLRSVDSASSGIQSVQAVQERVQSVPVQICRAETPKAHLHPDIQDSDRSMLLSNLTKIPGLGHKALSARYSLTYVSLSVFPYTWATAFYVPNRCFALLFVVLFAHWQILFSIFLLLNSQYTGFNHVTKANRYCGGLEQIKTLKNWTFFYLLGHIG